MLPPSAPSQHPLHHDGRPCPSRHELLWQQILHTPNLDRLANEGIRFNNCFVTNSLCAPGRATVLTGCFSNIHHIFGNPRVAMP